jgi:hypothetical protein
MENDKRYNTPKKKNDKIESMSEYNADQMGLLGQKGQKGDLGSIIRAKYYNRLRIDSELNLGGRRTKSVFKNKKNRTISLRRRKYSKKNRKSMKHK